MRGVGRGFFTGLTIPQSREGLTGSVARCWSGFSTTEDAEDTEGGDDGEGPKERDLPSPVVWGERGRGLWLLHPWLGQMAAASSTRPLFATLWECGQLDWHAQIQRPGLGKSRSLGEWGSSGVGELSDGREWDAARPMGLGCGQSVRAPLGGRWSLAAGESIRKRQRTGAVQDASRGR